MTGKSQAVALYILAKVQSDPLYKVGCSQQAYNTLVALGVPEKNLVTFDEMQSQYEPTIWWDDFI